MPKTVSKREQYRAALAASRDPDAYLLANSGLPGPRANLELVQAAAEAGDAAHFEQWLSLDAAHTPPDTALEFLPVCGAVGMGRLVAEGKTKYLKPLRAAASDSRWRVREGVAMGLQRWGEADMDALLEAMQTWSKGNLLEQRAVVAALCEPKLLKQRAQVKQVLQILDQISKNLLKSPNSKSAGFIALKKALSYGWSVAVAADPADGRRALEKWADSANPTARAIVRENLTKDRLIRMDPEWVEALSAQLH